MFSQRNNIRQLFSVTKKLPGNESGVTLLETLVALAILGLIAVALLSGLTTAARGTIIADEQATAGSLVRSQIEYVKSQSYISSGQGYQLVTAPASYSIELAATPIDPDTGQPLPSGDQGIQKITVTVKRNDNPILTVEDYMVDR